MNPILLIFSLAMLHVLPGTQKEKSVHDFALKSIDGKEVRLSAFKGKKLLIVKLK